MNGPISNEGVQVLKVGVGSQRYELDEEALKRVLLHPDVRDLPVVVVSIGGAFRGGKSFILDFFLRYLNAPRSSQLNGEWMGKDDEPLKGFHWRGGGERDTTGIHLWPEPVITTMGEYDDKVAVLLMDTQGTFDSDTTIRENSTIFALSTLMSSVQIYNLSGNIKEDDLQHLQLFTEYGKLASQEKMKAFQTLLVLVRDWEHYDHDHGYGGGRELLNARLQFKPNQKKELQQVREHIRSCFQKIECFLMPHPGKLVAKRAFVGHLHDIDEDFRSQLRDFVPSIFDPKHLTPKSINGERVTAQDLLEFFRKYVEIFNSDEIPEALTIFQATAGACMAAAVRAARELYESRMGEHVREQLSVPKCTLQDWHDAAQREALECYEVKKKIGSKQDIELNLNELKKELEGRLTLYMWKNEANVRDTTNLAKNVYEEAVSAACNEPARLCLHPLDLQQLLAVAQDAALSLFDSKRQVPEDEEDEDKATLVQSLEQRHAHFCAVNKQNNNTAILGARDVYVTKMKLSLDVAVNAKQLRAQHKLALQDALAHFDKQRNRSTEQKSDPYKQKMLEEIDNLFTEFKNKNTNNNRSTMQAVQFSYNNEMMSDWGPQSCCFHPRALLEIHEKNRKKVIDECLANRKGQDDEFRTTLINVLNDRYSELKQINEFNNQQAVESALALYTRKMDKRSQPSMGSILIVPFITKILLSVPNAHTKASELAEQEFYRRRRGPNYARDEYLDALREQIEMHFSKYSDFRGAVKREFVGYDEEDD